MSRRLLLYGTGAVLLLSIVGVVLQHHFAVMLGVKRGSWSEAFSIGAAPTVASECSSLLPDATDDSGLEALQTGLVFDGVRHFRNKCLTLGKERIELVDPPTGMDAFEEEAMFLLRDVCALGHFPKDLTHLHTYEVLHKVKSPLRIVLGHRCVTNAATHIANKRTPVFHSVLVHWVRAISGRYDFQGTSLPSSTQLSGSGGHRLIHTFWDVSNQIQQLQSKRTPSSDQPETLPLCYRHVVEREEQWRWFGSTTAADGFRQKLWHYLNVNYASEQLERRQVPFAKQRPLNVVVLRRDEDRHFNERVCVDYVRRHFGKVANIRYEQFDSPADVNKITPDNNITVPEHVDQLRLLFETDVLIAAHGAGLSNIVVMQPGAVVIELFPHNFRYSMYEELARVMNLVYVAFEGESVSPAGCCRRRQMSQGGVTLASLQGKRECKKCDISIPNATLYQLTKNALSTVWLRNARLSDVHHFDVRR